MSRVNDVADAIATYLLANQNSLTSIVASIEAAPVTYYATDAGCGPRIFCYPVSASTIPDTRNSWRREYQVGVTVASLLSTASEDELREMQNLAERVKNILRDVPMSGAEFMQIGEESAVPEFSVEDESLGQYFTSSVLLNYIEMDDEE